MDFQENIKYTKTHEWIKFIDETTALIGLTDFAQHELGDLVFVNLPQIGDVVTVGEVFADVESVKSVSDVYSPVSGTVSEINEELINAPEKINEVPYEAWLIKVSDISGQKELLSVGEYKDFVGKEAE